jgi:predicted  nucleic acid-binding Zn-ribbon protein
MPNRAALQRRFLGMAWNSNIGAGDILQAVVVIVAGSVAWGAFSAGQTEMRRTQQEQTQAFKDFQIAVSVQRREDQVSIANQIANVQGSLTSLRTEIDGKLDSLPDQRAQVAELLRRVEEDHAAVEKLREAVGVLQSDETITHGNVQDLYSKIGKR